MDIRKIKKLIELLEESGINELEITEGEESVRISRNGSAPQYAPMQHYAPAPQQYAPAPAAAPASSSARANCICPAAGGNKPAKVCSKVLLPMPDRPLITRHCPVCSCNDNSRCSIG